MLILGIETSCDETGIALYDGKNKKIIFEALYSQADHHSLYGGVVPELAARDHINKLLPLLKNEISLNNLELKAIDAIAYTKGPGLRGPLMVGTAFSKALAFSLDIPTFPIHHMEAHLVMAKFDAPELTYPFISLLVSGGHSLLAKVQSPGNYQIIGESMDDAVGEAFDKTAKLLGLKYPGGPEIERISKQGKLTQLVFPRPMLKTQNINFSFSGLKTAVLYEVRRQQESNSLDEQKVADIALAFQDAAIECLVVKSIKAMDQEDCSQLVLSGGVAANLSLRNSFQKKLTDNQSIFYPDMSHCTDNGVMIAFAGAEKLNFKNEDHKIEVNPRWSLEALNER